MFNSQKWEATILDSVITEHFYHHRKFCWIAIRVEPVPILEHLLLDNHKLLFTLFLGDIFLEEKKRACIYYHIELDSASISSRITVLIARRSVMQWVSISPEEPPLNYLTLIPYWYQYCRHIWCPRCLNFPTLSLGVNWREFVSMYQNCKCVYHLPHNPTSGNLFYRTGPKCVKWLVHQVTHCGIVCHSTWRGGQLLWS